MSCLRLPKFWAATLLSAVANAALAQGQEFPLNDGGHIVRSFTCPSGNYVTGLNLFLIDRVLTGQIVCNSADYLGRWREHSGAFVSFGSTLSSDEPIIGNSVYEDCPRDYLVTAVSYSKCLYWTDWQASGSFQIAALSDLQVTCKVPTASADAGVIFQRNRLLSADDNSVVDVLKPPHACTGSQAAYGLLLYEPMSDAFLGRGTAFDGFDLLCKPLPRAPSTLTWKRVVPANPAPAR